MKLLTVVIPVYNAEKYIERCLESLLCQIENEYEILLINDGSRDNSLRIVRRYAKEYPGVVRVINQENRGTAATRNRGIKEAKGTYIFFVDNDDYIDLNYFVSFLEEADNQDIVLGGYRRVSEDAVKFEIKPIPSKWYPFTVVAPWAKLYRKDFLVENDIRFLEYGIGEDVYFSLLAYSKTNRIKVIDYVGYNWFYNSESISNTVQRGFQKDPIFLLESIYNKIEKQNKMYEMYYVRYVIWYLLFSGKRATSREFNKEYKRLFGWLKEKKIALKFPIFSSALYGEKWGVKIIVNLFLLLNRMRMISLFAKLYCRRNV